MKEIDYVFYWIKKRSTETGPLDELKKNSVGKERTRIRCNSIVCSSLTYFLKFESRPCSIMKKPRGTCKAVLLYAHKKGLTNVKSVNVIKKLHRLNKTDH